MTRGVKQRRDARPYQPDDAPFAVLLAVVLGVFLLALLGLAVIQPYLS